MAYRFVVIQKESTLTKETKIIVDTCTGVNYLWHHDGSAGGLTVLLDKDGKPVITPINPTDK